MDGNDLQSQGVIDLVHILAQQALKEDEERREEDRRKAVEAAQAAQLGPFSVLVTLRAYCNRSCLCVCGGRAVSVTTITRNFVHRSSPNWVCRCR